MREIELAYKDLKGALVCLKNGNNLEFSIGEVTKPRLPQQAQADKEGF